MGHTRLRRRELAAAAPMRQSAVPRRTSRYAGAHRQGRPNAMTGAPPQLKTPPGATDTHMHFYGPFERWPLASTSPNRPPEALVADYRKVQQRLGLQRVVVVQPSGY